MEEKKFICMKDAAQVLGINVQSMKKELDKGKIKYRRLGRKILISRDNLMKYYGAEQ